MLIGQQGSWDSRQEVVYAGTDHLQSSMEIQVLVRQVIIYTDSKDVLKYVTRHLRW